LGVTLLGFFIFLLEAIGGVLSGSLFLLSDALHVFADNGANIFSLLVAYAVRKRFWNERKLRALSGYAGAVFLGLVAVWIFAEGLARLQSPPKLAVVGMIPVAVAGALLNYLQYRMLEVAHRGHITHESMRFHVRADFLQSAMVAVAGVAIAVTGRWELDPLFSGGVATIMIFWTARLFVKSTKEFRS
jgi:cobalt-zinc-cadmium efflux system protein